MFRIALCDDDSNSIEILEKHFDKLNNYSLEYDVYFRADELYSHKLKNNLVYDILHSGYRNAWNERTRISQKAPYQ